MLAYLPAVVLADQPAFPHLVSGVSWVLIVQYIVLPVILPLLVGLVSNSKWSTLAKRLSLGVLTLIGSVATGIIGAAQTNTSYDVGMAVFSWLLTWGVAELAYWKLLSVPASGDGSTSVASVFQAVGDNTKK